MRIADIKTELVSRLWQITEFVSVLDYVWTNLQGYPAAFVKYRGWESTLRDTIRNSEVHNFDIIVVYNYNEEAEADNVMMDLVEKVLDKLDEDRTLGWKVQVANVTWVDEDYIDDAWEFIMFVITVQCTLFKNR